MTGNRIQTAKQSQKSSSMPSPQIVRPVPPLACKLPSLPAEVIENIASFLEDELLDFRLSCREIQDKTWRVFKERYFALRQVWIERHSLETLLAISKYEPLASAVRKLVIAIHIYPDEYIGQLLAREDIEHENIRDIVQDLQTLRFGGVATSMLTRALSKFPNLKHMRIGEAYKLVKPASTAKVDWDNVRRHHLSNSMVKMYNKHNIYPTDTYRFGYQVEEETLSTWIIALSSLSLSGVLLDSFKVKKGPGLDSSCLQLCSTALAKEIQTSWGGSLQQLRLRIRGSRLQHDDDEQSVIGWETFLSKFLANFNNLTDLTLEFTTSGADLPLVNAIQHFPVFPQLQRLTITGAHMKYELLLRYLEKLVSLQELLLHTITLLNDGNVQQGVRTSVWKPFLERLSQSLNLQKLEVHYAQDVDGRSGVPLHEEILFDLEQIDNRVRDPRKLVLQGPQLATEIERVVNSTITHHSSWWRNGYDDDNSTYDSDFEYGVDHTIHWDSSSSDSGGADEDSPFGDMADDGLWDPPGVDVDL